MIAEIHSEHEQKKKLLRAQLKVECLHYNLSIKVQTQELPWNLGGGEKMKYPEGVDICSKIVLS